MDDQRIHDAINRWQNPSVLPIVHSRPITGQERHALFHEIKRLLDDELAALRAKLAEAERERDEYAVHFGSCQQAAQQAVDAIGKVRKWTERDGWEDGPTLSEASNAVLTAQANLKALAGKDRSVLHSLHNRLVESIRAERSRADTAESALSTTLARAAVLEEALTPSGDTKAAYHGEFTFSHPELDADLMVPWTTVKEIMAAIKARADAAKAIDGTTRVLARGWVAEFPEAVDTPIIVRRTHAAAGSTEVIVIAHPTNEGASMSEMKYTPDDAVFARLTRDFTYHPPKPDQPGRYTAIRDAAGALASALVQSCPQSRELSLAITNLEQAVFWANAAIARNE